MHKKMLAIMAALVMALSAVGAWAQPAEDPVLATFNGQDILKSEVDAVIPQLAGYMSDATDYRYAAEFIVQRHMIDLKIQELGFNNFSQEEQASFASEAEKQWQEGIESYVSYYLAEDSEEARAQLRTQAEEFYAQQGMTRQSLEENIRQSASTDKLFGYLVEEGEPTEEEIQSTFQLYGESYKQNYQDNIMAYEYNTYYNQQPSWYTPEGYRGIVHILLTPDAEKLETYSSLNSRYEEQQSDKNGEGTEAEKPAGAEAATQEPVEEVTLQMIEDAGQAVLDSVKTQTDEIYAKLANGESFESLIALYGQDPGMQNPQTLADGYSVHKDSILWDPVFTQTAFSDKMVNVGDVSDPVIGSSGVHILKYLRDVPSGLIMTDAIRAEIIDYLKAVKENDAIMTAIADWTSQYQITYNEENILAATEAAKALEPDDDTMEAVPTDDEEAVEVPGVTEAPN